MHRRSTEVTHFKINMATLLLPHILCVTISCLREKSYWNLFKLNLYVPELSGMRVYCDLKKGTKWQNEWSVVKESHKRKDEKMEGTRLNIAEKMSSLLFLCIHLAPLCQEPFPWNLTFSRTTCSLWLPDIRATHPAGKEAEENPHSNQDWLSYRKSVATGWWRKKFRPSRHSFTEK